MIEPRDERWSAWIDGELGPDELARLEAEFAADPRRRTEAEAFRDRVFSIREALSESVDRPSLGAKDRALRHALEGRGPRRVAPPSGGAMQGGRRGSPFLAVVGSLAAAGFFGALVFWALETPPPRGIRTDVANGVLESANAPETTMARPKSDPDRVDITTVQLDEEEAEEAFEESLTRGIEYLRGQLERQRGLFTTADAAPAAPVEEAEQLDDVVRTLEHVEGSLEPAEGSVGTDPSASPSGTSENDPVSESARIELAEEGERDRRGRGAGTRGATGRGGRPDGPGSVVLRETFDGTAPSRTALTDADDFFLGEAGILDSARASEDEPAVLAILSPSRLFNAPDQGVRERVLSGNPELEAGRETRALRMQAETRTGASRPDSVAVVELVVQPSKVTEIEGALTELLARAALPESAGRRREGPRSADEALEGGPVDRESATESPEVAEGPATGGAVGGRTAEERAERSLSEREEQASLRAYLGRQTIGEFLPVELFDMAGRDLEPFARTTGRQRADSEDEDPVLDSSTIEPDRSTLANERELDSNFVSLIEGPRDRILRVILAIDRRLRQIDPELEFSIVEPTPIRRPATLFFLATDEADVSAETDVSAEAPPRPTPLRFVIRLSSKR